MATTPIKYDMTKLDDVERWFDEMNGYFRTEDFIHQGTDLEGRAFAIDGFEQLRMQIREMRGTVGALDGDLIGKLRKILKCLNQQSWAINQLRLLNQHSNRAYALEKVGEVIDKVERI